MNKKILIAGGSGSIGNHLTQMLIERGYKVAHLGRKKRNETKIEMFLWDPSQGIVDENAFKDCFAVVNLAGSGIADERWSEKRKQDLTDSRIQSTELLVRMFGKYPPSVFVSASAVGYYGHTEERLVDEMTPKGIGFMPDLCKKWEDTAFKAEMFGVRTAMLRIGVVLDKNHGALKELAKPAFWGFGAALGSGKQFIPWIHYTDLCRMILYAIENDRVEGLYNASAPNPVTNKVLTQTLCSVISRPFWLPAVPAVFLKLMLGEMSKVVLEGQRTSADKIKNAGFTFTFPEIKPALQDLYLKK
jgi:uncharacterized protein (TIGR01777 family)